MSDSVHVSGAAAEGFNAISETYDLGDFSVWIQPERAAWLLLILRKLPDREDWFPRGKWATIQHLEAELDKQVVAITAAASTGDEP